MNYKKKYLKYKMKYLELKNQIGGECPNIVERKFTNNCVLINLGCKKEDISMLFKMLTNLDQVEKGEKSLASVELKLGNELADQYIYPKMKK